MKVSELKTNPTNPRTIKDDKFKKLVQSLKDFPEMMEKRPLVCVTDTSDGKLYPLGGNMRLKALQELKYKDIPDSWVMIADDWTEEQRREFIVKDNIGYGEWNWDMLESDWSFDDLENWGLDIHSYEAFDGDIDDFFENIDEKEKENKHKVVLCPHCGRDINDTADENGIRATKEKSDGEYIKEG